MRKKYASDISREVFEELEPILSSARKTTKPRRVDLYEVFCAILYLLKSGCQWDMLPSDFPKKSTVYYYFKLWKDKPSEDELSLLEQALKKCGWRGPRQQWTEREHDFRDR
jgi:transposase